MKRNMIAIILAMALVLLSTFMAGAVLAADAPSNIALRRVAWHSSAANYDNAGQLVTDGILGVLSNEVIDMSGTSADNPRFGQMIPGVVNSEWISASSGEEWVYIDLGAVSDIDSVTVHWGSGYASKYQIQISDDAKAWTTAANAVGAANVAVTSAIPGVKARYVRVLCLETVSDCYAIGEIEVLGTNSVAYSTPDLPPPEANGDQRLTGGNWTIQRASLVESDGAALSSLGYDDSAWLPATVPGTAFVSYLNAGAVADPYYDDWQFQASDIFFTADFWYRDAFDIPASKAGQRVYLEFDAINWKADVYFNGHLLPNDTAGYEHSIEGAFTRAKFDVTEFAKYGEANALAVLINRNTTPGLVTTQGLAEGPLPNGGELGQDNPTMHAAVGWDWLPTIRGRDIGIYNDVTVTYGGDAQIENAWIETDLDITEISSNVAAVSLAIGKDVNQPVGQTGIGLEYLVDDIVDNDAAHQWIAQDTDGAGFTIDLGEPTAINSLQLVWGFEPGGAAAEAEDRHPAKFKIEASDDGVEWRLFDTFAGGDVNTGWFGVLTADATEGTAEYVGQSISNDIEGPKATVILSFPGWGEFPWTVDVPQTARYIRFTTLEQRAVEQMGNKLVAPRVKEIFVYAQTVTEVGQSTIKTYALDASKADLTYRADIVNHSDTTVSAVVKGVINPGAIVFEQTIEIPANTSAPVEISGIVLDAPELWWPNTYGGQPLYTAEVTVSINGAEQDSESFKFGVREFTYPTPGNLLTLYCNGTRILAKGGNWGMDDGLKTDTPEKYDDKMRLHAEENFTMIRNWVGMTNNKAFYEAADKYGILIWDDFWLANPVDGPNPDDETMFLDNALDKIRKNRYHAALALYCGRNESSPPPNIDEGLAKLTQEYDGTRFYFPNSAGAPVGSGGGYSIAAMPNRNNGTGIREYFDEVPNITLRSECGIPNVPSLESMKKFLPEDKLWPINESWALHDWTYHMNGPANTYMDALQLYKPGEFTVPTDNVQGQNPDPNDPVFIEYKAQVLQMIKDAGKAYTLEEFSKIAQLINFENFKGVFEGLTVKRSNGFLMWMSQSSWPSFMWQTYDWYLDTNAGYFGAKSANQATHAVWDPRDDSIVLSNMTPYTYANVTTTMRVFDLNGNLVSEPSYQTESLNADTYGLVLAKATDEFAKSPTELVFLRLTVNDEQGNVLGDTLYWHNWQEYMRYQTLNDLAEVTLDATVSAKEAVVTTIGKGNDLYLITLTNSTAVPAVQSRIRAISTATGEDILPVFYSDNYFSLMPGESKTISVEYNPKYLQGGDVTFELSGWNTATLVIK